MKFFFLLFFFSSLSLSFSTLMKLNDEMSNQVNSILLQIKNSNMPPAPDVDIDNPKVSVIIPVYNEENYLNSVLKSIQFQTMKEIEIIFVDDFSTDGSYKLMKKFKKADKRVRIIKNKKSQGILYNRIYGALQAKGEYITFIDADDMYCNINILQEAYNKGKEHKLDLIQYDYFGGRYDGKNGFNTFLLATTVNKDRTNKILVQPEIRNNFFYINKSEEDLISGIVYDKLYSRKLIKRMADAMGADCWNTHLIYMEDFIISLAAAREAKSYMLLPFGGIWHWYENPEGMTKGVFEMEGDRLKYPENTNKKLGDYLYVWEKCFDMTEDDPDAEVLRIKMIVLLAQPDNRHIFARTVHFDRIMALCRRFMNWKYASEENIKFVKKFGRESIAYTVDMKKKYREFYEDDDETFDRVSKKNKKVKSRKRHGPEDADDLENDNDL